ncbi:carboxymuconolactone decarboxylase family protein [Embleya hyalina]|uniref:4-carboxymuconolactone decarboxylase n=1 Tax=Embleya hyalina TaxID=516124 RepID=A0A401YQH9_9ACTN|nr:carboxymuconolactone decarboxylase family protein [Embleya hyalina]GCD96860.1 4-carboxymuconolactone decarboxylase [Embleya hyalina]
MNDRLALGLARQAELAGPDDRRRDTYARVARIAPDLPRLAIEFAWGDIHRRPGLDAARRELVVLGALIALGGVHAQIESHLDSALNAGLSPGELVEAIMQALPYAGFPRVFAAMDLACDVFERRGVVPARPPDMKE